MREKQKTGKGAATLSLEAFRGGCAFRWLIVYRLEDGLDGVQMYGRIFSFFFFFYVC